MKIFRLWLALSILMPAATALTGQAVNQLFGDVVPPTPNAASMGKFIDIPVGHHTGVPSISVPIHTVREGTLSLPIGLSYHASGLKVADVASWVGLGWSLSAGGMITRTVQGLPDERPFGYFNGGNQISLPTAEESLASPVNEPMEGASTLYDIGRGWKDGEADIFSFSFGGHSGKFYYESDGSIVLIPKQDILIERYLGPSTSGDLRRLKGFKVTTPDGAKYYFGVSDAGASSSVSIIEMYQQRGSGIQKSYPTSWMLVKVESHDGRHVINLSYDAELYSFRNHLTKNNLSGFSPDAIDAPYMVSIISGHRLREIKTTFETVTFLASPGNREDLTLLNEAGNAQGFRAAKLDAIRVDADRICRRLDFDYSYWQDNSPYATQTVADKRLRLNSVTQRSCSGPEALPPYVFNYIGEGTGFLPNRLSKASDHWGYYNGADANNQELGLNIPDIDERVPYTGTRPISQLPIGDFDDSGNIVVRYPSDRDRDTHEEPMKLGTLERITYPTGGSHSFEYEANCCYEESVTYNNDSPVWVDARFDDATCMSLTFGHTTATFTGDDIPKLYYESNFTQNECGGSSTSYVFRLEIRRADNNQLVTSLGPGSGWLAPALQPGTLQPGVAYTFSVVSTYTRGYFKLFNRVRVTEMQTKKVGGLRVKRTAAHDGVNPEIDIVKDYRYEWSSDPVSGSSLALYNKPRYWYTFYNRRVFSGLGDEGNLLTGTALNTIFIESGIYNLSDFQGNHYGYGRVVEFEEGLGYREHIFRTTPFLSGVLSSAYTNDYDDFPYAPAQSDVLTGSLSVSSTYSEDGDMVQSESQSPLFGENPVDYLVYKLGAGQMVKVYTLPSGGGTLWTIYNIRTHHPFMPSQTTSMLDGVTKTTSYEYDGLSHPNTPHHNVTASSFVNSDGKLHRQEIYYALEQNDSYMRGAHMVSIPLKVRNLINGTVASGFRLGMTNGYPYKYFNILEDNTELLDAETTSYTAEGFPRDYQARGFPKQDYIWQGRLLQETRYGTWRRQYTYLNGTGSRLPVSVKDIDGQVQAYAYDGLGRLKTVTARGGNIVTGFIYEYGAPNKVTATTTYSDAPRQKAEQIFDGLGRETFKIVNDEVKWEAQYDHHGRAAMETYLPGSFVTYAFEPSLLKRDVGQTYPDGGITKKEYGAFGNAYMLTFTDEKENRTRTVTDLIGRHTRTINALDGQTVTGYGNNGLVSRVIAPNEEAYDYKYDTRRRLEEKVVPAAGATTFKYYDTNDLLMEQLDANGNRLKYEYDQYGRMERTLLTGQPILHNEYGDALGGIYVGKLVATRAKMLDAPGEVATSFTFDPFGRVKKQVDLYPVGQGRDEYDFTLNHADWLKASSRSHQGHGGTIKLESQYSYDNFGREILARHSMPGTAPLVVSQSYDQRDLLVSKRFGPGAGLDRQVYEYNARGWLTRINEIRAGVQDADAACGRVLSFGTDLTEEVEETVDLAGLLGIISTGDPVVLDDLDPCDYPNCFEREDTYCFYIYGEACLTAITGAGGERILDFGGDPLCSLHEDQEQRRLLTQKLGSNLLEAGYRYERIQVSQEGKGVRICITATNYPFVEALLVPCPIEYVLTWDCAQTLKAIATADGKEAALPSHGFKDDCDPAALDLIRQALPKALTSAGYTWDALEVGVSKATGDHFLYISTNSFVPVTGLFDCPPRTGQCQKSRPFLNVSIAQEGEGGCAPQVAITRVSTALVPCRGGDAALSPAQPADLTKLDLAMRGKKASDLTYPTVLYTATFAGGAQRWVLREELPLVEGHYTLGRRIPLRHAGQQVGVEDQAGKATLDVDQLLQRRTLPTPLTPTKPEDTPKHCDPVPLGCTAAELEAQQASVAAIYDAMAGLDPASLALPANLHLVQLCDGTTMYIFGDDILATLQGPHVVLATQSVKGASQRFRLTRRGKGPLFAAQYAHEPNGNIARMDWQAAGLQPAHYTFGYDPLNRLLKADYGVRRIEAAGGGIPFLTEVATQDYRLWGVTYDAVGNIQTLNRRGMAPDGSGCLAPGVIDQLAYRYDPAPTLRNRLADVADASADPAHRPEGFRPASAPYENDAYAYDGNGNLTADAHKSLTFQYNFLNLPRQITKAGTGALTNTYDATGRKWQAASPDGIRTYLSGIEYLDGQVQTIPLPDGRFAKTPGGAWRTEYHHKDHLGNLRVAFADLDGNGRITHNTVGQPQEVTQEEHYYPFGMAQAGMWYGAEAPGGRYKYNGKELVSDLGIDLMDYGFRFYDPAIGRWMIPDLLADWTPDLTPFRYGFNNPVLYIDPDGLFESRREARRYRRSNDLKGKIRKNKETGEYEIHLKESDGRIRRDRETKEIEYSAVASYTGSSVKEYKSNFFEDVQNSGFVGNLIYGLANDAWLTTQRFNPFDTHTTHLAGHYASKDEYTMGLVNTVATAVPVGRAATTVKSLSPTGLILTQRLNAAQFSSRFKGTMLARTHPRIRGRLNRLLNKGIDQVNTNLETGNAVLKSTKSLGEAANNER